MDRKFTELAVMFDSFKYIPRLSTKRVPIDEKESVAVHIYEMMYLAYLTYYSIEDKEFRAELDMLTILKLIMWHEADEYLTNDIPYPAKKELRNGGNADALRAIKEASRSFISNLTPDVIKYYDQTVYDLTFDLIEATSDKKFVKLLDYVNLYLNLFKYKLKGYPVDLAIDECKKITMDHEMYNKCPLIVELIENPTEFLTLEHN